MLWENFAKTDMVKLKKIGKQEIQELEVPGIRRDDSTLLISEQAIVAKGKDFPLIYLKLCIFYFPGSETSAQLPLQSTPQEQNQLLWAYVQSNNQTEHVQELSADAMPRVKLTGTGKMPVVDMRKGISQGQPQYPVAYQNGQQNLNSGHPSVKGLPPKSPVYALVNKLKKKSPVSPPSKKPPMPQPAHMHNYCNVSPLLGDVISKKPELFKNVQPNQVFASLNKAESQGDSKSKSQTDPGANYENLMPMSNAMKSQDNYLEMGPGNNLIENYKEIDELPIRPFEPLDYRNRKPNEEDPMDPISLRLQELQDALEDDSETFADLINPGDFNLSDLGQELPPPPPELLKSSSPCAKHLSSESLPKEDQSSLSGQEELNVVTTNKPVKNGFDTMPRTANKNSHAVQPSFMRRSSSVPCKNTGNNNRGSTSSSDSGFSPGSPNAGQVSCMNNNEPK